MVLLVEVELEELDELLEGNIWLQSVQNDVASASYLTKMWIRWKNRKHLLLLT
jgi:hypothetical protein